ncbi:transmembrane protein 180 [Trypanosoma conorhini]|uniref:Transmembrane protein 180 n=1 Tax=Trypanosoma conorhini TaxID=83891 RepID=A0A3R7LF29_9TRYP|nr:transmembrane protein 180 [Trypanosoma conorhini]RNF25979.1 transmembrane protein 180 [Trypanosoma conorhini]
MKLRLKHIGVASMIILHAIFTAFYMDVFMRQHMPGADHRGVGATSRDTRHIFWCLGLGQLLYAVWNGTHGVAFELQGRTCSALLAYLKLWRLSRAGPTWAVSFILLWSPFSVSFLPPAVMFTLWLVLYDYFLAHCEAALRAQSRGEFGSTERGFFVYHALGGVGVATAYYLVELSGVRQQGALFAFRCFTTICGFLAALILYACGRQQRKLMKHHGCEDECGTAGSEDFLRFARQTVNRCSMKAAMLFWALQGYSSLFATAFFNIFLAMSSNTVSVPVRILLLLLVHAAPHAVVAVAASFFKVMGKKSVIGGFLAARAVLGVLLLAVASQEAQSSFSVMGVRASSSLFVLLLFLNRVLTDTVGMMQESILCDLVDEDTVIFFRVIPATDMARRLLATAAKPLESVALVLTFIGLASMGCSHTKHLEEAAGAVALAGGTVLFTSSLMLWGWRRHYNLEGSHLQFVRMALRKRADKDARVVLV